MWKVASPCTRYFKFFVNHSSSGLTMSGGSNISQSLPAGEIQLNDVALNHYGTVLYSAAGDKVRVWDLRK
jgi:kinesin family protein 4/21/27